MISMNTIYSQFLYRYNVSFFSLPKWDDAPPSLILAILHITLLYQYIYQNPQGTILITDIFDTLALQNDIFSYASPQYSRFLRKYFIYVSLFILSYLPFYSPFILLLFKLFRHSFVSKHPIDVLSPFHLSPNSQTKKRHSLLVLSCISKFAILLLCNY